MTIGSEDNRNQYVGNNSTTQFAYTFKVFNKEHIEVILKDGINPEVVQTLDVDYTVSGIGNDNGGQINFITAPDTGVIVTILRDQPITQDLDYQQDDPFPSDATENALDKQVAVDQQLAEELSRTLQFEKSIEPSAIPKLPSLIGNAERFVKVRTDETGFEYITGDSTVPSGGSPFDDLNGVSNVGGSVNITSDDASIVVDANDTSNTIDLSVAGGGNSFAGLSDVDVAGADTGSSVYYDGTEWVNDNSAIFNVKHFGAVGDGVAVDTTAVQAAITALETNLGGTLYFPAGIYLIDATLTISQRVVLKGDGIRLTTLKKTNVGNLFDFVGGASTTNTRKTCEAEGITFMATQANNGIALNIVYTTPAGQTEKYVLVRDCDFTSEFLTTTFWDECIHLTKSRNTVIKSCQFRGQFAGGTQFASGANAIVFDGLDAPTDHFIDSCHFNFFERGIFVDDEVEGVFVTNCVFVANDKGIVWSTDVVKPLLSVKGCHFSNFSFNMILTNLAQAVITGNHFQERLDATADSTSIQLNTSCENIHVADNFFRGETGNAFLHNGVVTTNTTQSSVQDNLMKDLNDAVSFDAGSSQMAVADNFFISCTNDIVDNAPSTLIELLGSGGSFEGALVILNADVPVANNTNITVSWDSMAYDTSGFWDAGNPERFTIPANTTKVRLKAQLQYDDGQNNGQRNLNIQKNLVGFVGGGNDNRSPAGNGSPTNLHCETPVVEVSNGDIFTVNTGVANQAAGDVIDSLNPTWFAIEKVE